MFVGLLHRTTKDVIPRRPVKADVGISRYDVCFCGIFRWIVPGDCHVAWLVPAMLLAMTVVVGSLLRLFKQSDKLKFEYRTQKCLHIAVQAFRLFTYGC